jgi:hypothetical protein
VKINLGKILKAIYTLAFKGKTVNVGGVKVTLPEQGSGPDFQDNKTFKN